MHDGYVDGATQVPSPNCDARPPEDGDLADRRARDLAAAGQFGGDAIERLFTNRLDPDAHPYFATIAGLRVSSHFLIRRERRAAAVRRRAARARGMPANRPGAAARAATTFRSASSSRARTQSPYAAAQYATLARLCGRSPRITESRTSRATATSPRAARPTRARASTGSGSPPLARGPLASRFVAPAAIRGIIAGLCAFSRTTFRYCSFSSRSSWQGIWVATAVAIAASIVQIAWFHWRGNVSAVHWLSLAIIVVFGGATLILRDETFIKWKPTVLYLAFAVILAAGKLVVAARLARAGDEGHRVAAADLDAAHVVVGGVLRRDGRDELVRRVPLSRPRRGSTSRSGAASACSCCSRSRRACSSPGT